jgi:hypothetical protein
LEHIEAANALARFSMFVLHWSIVISVVGGLLAIGILVALHQVSLPIAASLAASVGALTLVCLVLTLPACQRKYLHPVLTKN